MHEYDINAELIDQVEGIKNFNKTIQFLFKSGEVLLAL